MGALGSEPARSAGRDGGSDADSERSLWLQEALDADARRDCDPLRGKVTADIGIVGAGYTGLWTAIHLKRSDNSLKVAVVESDIAGGGASGRNGGILLSWWSKFSTLKKRCGQSDALSLARQSEQAVSAIGDFCHEHRIDSHYRRAGWLWTATNEAQLGAWRDTIADIERCGQSPFLELEPEEVKRRAGSDVHLAGVFERSAATLQPALLARGLRRVALELGIEIFERSPMVALREGVPAVIVTPNGELHAEIVVLAMNAWAARFREIRRRLVVTSSDIVSTDPIPDVLKNAGLDSAVGVSDSRRLVHYYRSTIDGRLVFGKGGGSLVFSGRIGKSFNGPSSRAVEVGRQVGRVIPQLANVPTPVSWSGPIDYSITGLPYFAALDGHENVLFGVGYSGNGIGPSFIGGKILSSLALRADDEWASSPLAVAPKQQLPLEPARYLGGRIVKAVIGHKERLEDHGKKPSRLTRRVAEIDPTSFVDSSTEQRES